MKLYNTLTRRKEVFQPIHKRWVGLYTCGPTVYNYAHIGNLRTYIFEDILQRTLEEKGYTVKRVMNITDVGHLMDDADEGEDKIAKAARREKKDPWQVAESRALGADCILIIMASLDDTQAAEIEAAATAWGMDSLIEVHDTAELERAQKLSSTLIGINNRDLHSFETTLDTTRRLAKLVEAGRTIVSESGLSTPADLADLARYGARCFLVGEALMRQQDVASATRDLLSAPLTSAGGM
ncbi:hypothetical protein LCGC14_3080240 [marine sediment metagenome]|uniref:indole-3-glycerol-phosphate synthase n=1 Tax=marine sediment metagenome TaxID=412755 RepID=A0A0F8Z4B1_9ZZZZ